jgi:hypothetical protein
VRCLLDDRDAPVARLANPVGGRHGEIVLTDAAERYRLRRHAQSDERIADAFRPPFGQSLIIAY